MAALLLSLAEMPLATTCVCKPPDSISFVIKAQGLTRSGGDTSLVEMLVEQFEEVAVVPLLPYIFFYKESADIPDRYALMSSQGVGSFQLRGLVGLDQIGVYHNLLNIVGERMRDSLPRATLTIVGRSSQNAAGKDLAHARAVAVQSYLHSTWGIHRDRLPIDLSARILEGQTATDSADRQDMLEEELRVELVASDPRILQPLELRDTVTYTNPPIVRFAMTSPGNAKVYQWKLLATQGNRELYSDARSGALPDTLLWRIQEFPDRTPLTEQPIIYTLKVLSKQEHSDSVRDTVVGQFTVHQRTILKKRRPCQHDHEIDRYRLILFGFNSDEILSENRSLLERLGARIRKDGAERVVISGNTDRVGEAAYNQGLSERRARVVAEALGITPENARGEGERRLLHDNSIPEGRFYSRTVDIEAWIRIDQPCD